jgi:hypothetical protein
VRTHTLRDRCIFITQFSLMKNIQGYKLQVTSSLYTGHEGPEGEWRYISTLSLTSALDGGRWSKQRPSNAPAALSRGKRPVTLVQEAGWVPLPVCTGEKNLVYTRIRSRDRPARSKSHSGL